MKRYFTVSLLALMLSGCGTFGGNPYSDVDIDSVRKAIIVANAEVRGANLLLKEVIQSRLISQVQAQRSLDALQTAKDGLQNALNAVDLSGDPLLGQDHLDTALRSLDLVLQILAPLVAPAPPSASFFSEPDLKEAA